MNPELEALKGALDRQREHVLKILEGLAEEDLRRPVLPSGWNCLALVRHLTLDVERFWFLGVIAGEPDVAGQFTADAETHWYVPEGMSAEEVFADYRTAIVRADAVLATAAPEQEPAAWPVEIWPAWRMPDVRHILIHVLTEVACHSGHLDAVRELIDGTTWLGGSPYAGSALSSNPRLPSDAMHAPPLSASLEREVPPPPHRAKAQVHPVRGLSPGTPRART